LSNLAIKKAVEFMPQLQGYTLKETLFSNNNTEVFRAKRDSDEQSFIVRTLSEMKVGKAPRSQPDEAILAKRR